MKDRARHFDRGFSFAASALALLAACSSSLSSSNPGAAGRGGGGTTGIGGDGGTTGIGGDSGTTGAGGSAGASPLPACTATGPTFGVCFVSDAETTTASTTLSTSGTATIEAVGAGAAPASCTSRHVIGTGDSSQSWFRARAADNHLWTIGVLGLAATPVQVGDTVSLDLDWRDSFPVPGVVVSDGKLQISDAAGTPLLWAGANPSPSTWISFSEGDAACSADTCLLQERVQTNAIATVNGSSMKIPPYGAASLGGYRVQVTSFAGFCGDYAPPFEAAATRIATSPAPQN